MKFSHVFPALLLACGLSSVASAQTSVPNTKGSDMPGGTITSNSQQPGAHSTTPAGQNNAANTAAGGNTTSQNSAPSASQPSKAKGTPRKGSGKMKSKTM